MRGSRGVTPPVAKMSKKVVARLAIPGFCPRETLSRNFTAPPEHNEEVRKDLDKPKVPEKAGPSALGFSSARSVSYPPSFFSLHCSQSTVGQGNLSLSLSLSLVWVLPRWPFLLRVSMSPSTRIIRLSRPSNTWNLTPSVSSRRITYREKHKSRPTQTLGEKRKKPATRPCVQIRTKQNTRGFSPLLFHSPRPPQVVRRSAPFQGR